MIDPSVGLYPSSLLALLVLLLVSGGYGEGMPPLLFLLLPLREQELMGERLTLIHYLREGRGMHVEAGVFLW